MITLSDEAYDELLDAAAAAPRPEPQPPATHPYEPYRNWKASDMVCANGCGASKLHPIHLV